MTCGASPTHLTEIVYSYCEKEQLGPYATLILKLCMLVLYLGSVSIHKNCELYLMIQWNLSITTTFIIRFITCDLFSNVF